jgi:hypothetical protein
VIPRHQLGVGVGTITSWWKVSGSWIDAGYKLYWVCYFVNRIDMGKEADTVEHH